MPAQRFVASRILSAEVCSKWNEICWLHNCLSALLRRYDRSGHKPCFDVQCYRNSQGLSKAFETQIKVLVLKRTRSIEFEEKIIVP